MQNCIQVWKSRTLSYKGKTIIVKNLLLSYCGFEIEMKGILDQAKKEIETLIWDIVNIVPMMYPQSFYIFFNP
jgi:hypothetical protein